MRTDDFLRCDPCIEEIEGFIIGLEATNRMTDNDRSILTTQVIELKRGDRIPGPTGIPRLWHYRYGKPARAFTAVEKALLEKKIADEKAARLAVIMAERKRLQETRRNSVIE